jgi:hypothetical protein
VLNEIKLKKDLKEPKLRRENGKNWCDLAWNFAQNVECD